MSVETPMISPEPISHGGRLLPQPTRLKPRTPSLFHQICQCLAVAALGLASYFFISHFFLQSVTVVGRSMAPTLSDSQRYLLNRWILYVRPPHREDIIVLRDLIDNSFAVKRVIGTPGDQVDLKGGKVFVNGRQLDEAYLPPGTPTFSYSKLNEQLFTCGKDQFFVLGDNRMNSADSRTYGPVPRRNILGLIVH